MISVVNVSLTSIYDEYLLNQPNHRIQKERKKKEKIKDKKEKIKDKKEIRKKKKKKK